MSQKSDYRYLWLSFCDTRKPEGEQFLGVIVTENGPIPETIARLCKMGINPGGEIHGFEYESEHVDPKFMNVLLTREQAEGLLS